MEAADVAFYCDMPHDDVKTANCIALVTPDGERTMNTFLGACVELSEADIPREAVDDAAIVFIEGYLLDSPSAALAAVAAARLAKQAAAEVALSLSDANCVRRNRQTFLSLVAGGLVDVLIGNEKEICAYFEDGDAAPTVDGALAACATLGIVSVMTLGADGARGRRQGRRGRGPCRRRRRVRGRFSRRPRPEDRPCPLRPLSGLPQVVALLGSNSAGDEA